MTEFAKRGSQRLLQIAVDRNRAIIDTAFQKALDLSSQDSIDWVSPVRATQFKEYRDMEALRQRGIRKLDYRNMSDFWRGRGPMKTTAAKSKIGRAEYRPSLIRVIPKSVVRRKDTPNKAFQRVLARTKSLPR